MGGGNKNFLKVPKFIKVYQKDTKSVKEHAFTPADLYDTIKTTVFCGNSNQTAVPTIF